MSPLAENYYRRCQVETSPTRLEGFLAEHQELSAQQLVEVLLVDQALEWQSGPGPNVETYLQRFPVVMEQAQAVLELVYGELRAARVLGRTLDVDAYLARFPDLAEPLRRQIEVSNWLVGEFEGPIPQDRPPGNQPDFIP